MRDPIVDEIRKLREEHAARFNYDMNAIFADIKRREKESGLPLVNLQRKSALKRTASSPRKRRNSRAA